MKHDFPGHWKATPGSLTRILIVWFLVSFGAGILFVDRLNNIKLGGDPVGFWSAHQGGHPVMNGMATTADWMSAASFILKRLERTGLLKFTDKNGDRWIQDCDDATKEAAAKAKADATGWKGNELQPGPPRDRAGRGGGVWWRRCRRRRVCGRRLQPPPRMT